MAEDHLAGAYRMLWGTDYEFPPQPEPLSREALEAAWLQAAQGVVKATRATWSDAADSIYHPHLTAFHAAIANSWRDLGQERVVAQILLLIQEMHDDPLVAVVAYEQFQASLELAGEPFLPKKAADLQKVYMDAHPTWREVRERLSHESLRTRAPDHIPGGLPEPPEPDEPLDESGEDPDPFAS